jgi:hypothetical protein
MFGFTREELRVLRALRTPARIQDFLETLPINFEPQGDTCRSPRGVLRERTAHCMEGAMLAAVALRLQGRPPFVLDLTAAAHDDDHVLALFREGKAWGAISKTNHAVLRYREPVYRTIRELVLSYFHEYTDTKGGKTLRSYSAPVDLSRFDRRGWMTADGDVWYVPEHLATIPHVPLLTRSRLARLRRADALEITAGALTDWKPK